MSRKDRSKIARENGAKSQGPITAAGKAASSQNANKSGEYAQKLAPFLPPPSAVLSNEDRDAFNGLLKELNEIYRPLNQIAAAIVQDIATARWQVERLDLCLATQWNLAIAGGASTAPEVPTIETMARAAQKLYTSGAVAHRINRQIDQLQLRIARFERRIKFVHANFPAVANQPAAPVETETPINEPTVNGEQRFPRCKIFVMPSPTASTPNTPWPPPPEKQHKQTRAFASSQ